MSNIIIEEFIRKMEPANIDPQPVSNDIVEKYKGVFLIGDDKIDVVYSLWNQFGLCGYKNGLFWLVNPDDYNPYLNLFRISQTGVVFGRSYCGGLFYLDRNPDSPSINYFNVHECTDNAVSASIEVFFEFNLPSESWWNRECFGTIELKALKEYGSINHNTCLTFVPALKLGGNQNVSKMEKVDILEHLNLLSQL